MLNSPDPRRSQAPQESARQHNAPQESAPQHRRRFNLAEHEVAPYAEALVAHVHTEPHMFMVPGHAATPDGLTAGLAEFIGERAVRLDIPQLLDGIDVGPESPFVRAEQLAADAWGAKRTWFLVNGSSQGNRLSMLAVAGLPRSTTDAFVLAQRSAHSSVSDGMILAGLTPIFLSPSIDHTLGINHGLTPEDLDRALTEAARSGQEVCAAQVVSPSYFGAISDIEGLARIAHSHGVPLIVDAAWGAHFGFHELLPESPSLQGADLVISSTHKMGGSLGQAAMIHLSEGPYAVALEPLIDRAFRLTQTTSASSLLFASLDLARRALVTHPELLASSIKRADGLRDWVRSHASFALVSDGFEQFADISGVDPLRVAIDVTGLGLTGYEVRSRLATFHNVYLEIATSGAVVAFFGPGKELDVSLLIGALEQLVEEAARERGTGSVAADPNPAGSIPALPDPGEARLTPREAYFSATEVVTASEAVGRVSADALAAYPPGIPNVVPGEVITAETVAFLQAVAASPIGYVRGSLDPLVTQFRVIAS